MIDGEFTVKDKIEQVLRLAGKPIAPHEFPYVSVTIDQGRYENGRAYCGCTEATLARRLRELVVTGKAFSRKREGKTFKEFGLVEAQQPVLV